MCNAAARDAAKPEQLQLHSALVKLRLIKPPQDSRLEVLQPAGLI